MGREIERKFLPRDPSWRPDTEGASIRQGYLCTDPERAVRVRAIGERGFVTVKGGSVGASRTEFEYEIPAADAHRMLDDLCLPPLIEKTRYRIEAGGRTWEVDVFHGDNEGLVVAEIELDDENEPIEMPPWAGDEVTGDERYYNVYLVRRPFTTW
jgi:adenylate cyclase